MNTYQAAEVEIPAPADTQFLPSQEKVARKLASVDRRFVAYVVDTLILAGLTFVVSGLGTLIDSEAWILLWMIVAYLFPFYYFVRAYSTNGQTLGKRLVGIRVVSIDGTPLTFGKGILRTIGYIVSGFPLDLGFLWAFWDKDKQTWHDKIAGTIVVKE